MWECRNCREEIEDRYKHCWHCGNPKPENEQVLSPVRIHRLTDEPPPEKVFAPENTTPSEEIPFKEETPPIKEIPANEELPFESALLFEEKSPSVIKKAVPVLLWLALVGVISWFAYSSYQKTKAFENRLREDAKNLSGQTSEFVFSPNAPREKNAVVKTKVLPLGAQNKQLDNLYYYLPDDLRPASAEEVKTLLWLDCKHVEAGRYEDGTTAYRDMCNTYLVDRETSKVIQVEDFLGELPPLKKSWGSSYASGKVLPEGYISFIKANQPEAERKPFAFASDSPNHHLWFKSEMLYSILLLILLGAVGIGWIVYQIKLKFGARNTD